MLFSFFFNNTATTEIYTLSLHDALPISGSWRDDRFGPLILSIVEVAANLNVKIIFETQRDLPIEYSDPSVRQRLRSEEHTSELQSQFHLVCRLLLEKKKK